MAPWQWSRSEQVLSTLFLLFIMASIYSQVFQSLLFASFYSGSGCKVQGWGVPSFVPCSTFVAMILCGVHFTVLKCLTYNCCRWYPSFILRGRNPTVHLSPKAFNAFRCLQLVIQIYLIFCCTNNRCLVYHGRRMKLMLFYFGFCTSFLSKLFLLNTAFADTSTCKHQLIQ